MKHCETIEHSPFDAIISELDVVTSALSVAISVMGAKFPVIVVFFV